MKSAAHRTRNVVSIGYPGPVLRNRPVSEPWNLGKGWCGFNFEAAFKRPTKVVNDAAMQALGSYKRGKMPKHDSSTNNLIRRYRTLKEAK